MKIVQVVERYIKGDGVGNVVSVIDDILKNNRYEASVCNRQLEYGDIDSELFSDDTIVFYHLARMMDPIIKELRCRKVLIFHNITKPELLAGIDEEDRMLCATGLYDASKTASYFDHAVTFSEYNKKCLMGLGWKEERVSVIPILVRLRNFLMEPSREIIQKYKGDSVNILFTGRVHPNKKQEDIIAAFAAYKELYNKNSKLFLVGSISPGTYCSSLFAYVKKLGIADDVVLPGHVSFADYLAYYRIADIYLCMSEHEGFCIPLVEAMHFGIPILAYASTAVPDTLSGSGVLVDEKTPENTAQMMNEIIVNKEYRQTIVDGQNNRMKQLCPEALEQQYAKVLDEIINGLKGKDDIQVNSNRCSGKYRFTLTNDLAGQLDKLGQAFKRYVIYGAGAAGRKLYMELRREGLEDKLLLCDSFKAGEFNPELDCNIISPEEAVRLYKEAAYIISIQDKKSVMEVTFFLAQYGIKKGQVVIYDMLADMIL